MADELHKHITTFIEVNIQNIWLIENLTSHNAVFSERNIMLC